MGFSIGAVKETRKEIIWNLWDDHLSKHELKFRRRDFNDKQKFG